MSVWNKILLGLVAVASLVFFHAALRTIKTFKHWSAKADAFQTSLEKARKEIIDLKTADHEHPLGNGTFGVQQLRFDLGRLLANRGRIWSNCQRRGIQIGKEGRVEVTATSDEGNFSDRMLLYIFEEGDDQSPGKYLGEYSVKAINQGGQASIVLASTTQPTQLQRKNLENSKMPWVLYEMMPSDQHLMRGDKEQLFAKHPDAKDELLATLPEELKKKFFPDPDPGLSKVAQDKWKQEKWWLPEEFVLDGQVVNGKLYDRRLRDYREVMRICEVERTLFDDRLNALTRDERYLKAAEDDSEQQLAFSTKEKAQALKEQEWESKQRQAAADHYSALQTMLGFNETAVKDLIEANARYAQQIAKIQKEAAEQIDRRTHSMARYGAGMN